MAGKKYIFTEEQINYIVENWGKESAHSMKKKFGCSWYAVCRVAEANGLEYQYQMNGLRRIFKHLQNCQINFTILK